jgi:hypothetical protein
MMDQTIGKIFSEGNAGCGRLLTQKQGQTNLQHGLFRYGRASVAQFMARLTTESQRNNSR